ncbi:hypothetical protein FOXB_04586, partial [Fusarium oxysporum f. sp. conglutinans Fo5176]
LYILKLILKIIRIRYIIYTS